MSKRHIATHRPKSVPRGALWSGRQSHLSRPQQPAVQWCHLKLNSWTAGTWAGKCYITTRQKNRWSKDKKSARQWRQKINHRRRRRRGSKKGLITLLRETNELCVPQAPKVPCEGDDLSVLINSEDVDLCLQREHYISGEHNIFYPCPLLFWFHTSTDEQKR